MFAIFSVILIAVLFLLSSYAKLLSESAHAGSWSFLFSTFYERVKKNMEKIQEKVRLKKRTDCLSEKRGDFTIKASTKSDRSAGIK